MVKKRRGIILPMFIEPNGKMEKFLEIAKDKETQKEYRNLIKKFGDDPQIFSRKLREIVWKGKSVDEIHEELL